MKNKILSIFLFFVTTLVAQEQKTLYPTDDTYVYQEEIRGMEPVLRTYHSTAGSQYRRQAFLKFDLRGISANIDQVTFRIYAENMHSNTNTKKHLFGLTPVSKTNWAEDDISFNDYLTKLGAMIDTKLVQIEVADATPAGYLSFQSPELTQMVIDSIRAGSPYIAFRLREYTVVKDAITNAAVVCDFHSKENISGFGPELIIEEQDVSALLASDITIDNNPLEQFNPRTYHYNIFVPWNTTRIPTINAHATHSEADVSIVQASSLSGTESERTARINISSNGKVLTYSVTFSLLPPPTDARLSMIELNGDPLEFFQADKDEYSVFLPYTTSSYPVLSAATADPYATASISQAAEGQNTAFITVRSANNENEKTYRVRFEILPKLDLILAIGQSNMAGRASFADYAEPMHNTFLLTPDGNMEIASNPLNKYSNIRKDLSIQGLSPAYQCMVELQNKQNKPLGIVVNAQGGSSINLWYENGKKNYDATIERAREALKFGEFKAIIWHQGSADNNTTDNYLSYKQKLASMVNNFRKDLDSPQLPFICGELSTRPEFSKFNQTVIHAVSDYIDHADYIITDETKLLPDGIHFDKESNILLGKRYAEKVLQLAYPESTGLIPVLNQEITMERNADTLLINNKGNDTWIRINDLSGKLILQREIKSNKNISIKLIKGIYLISIENEQVKKTQKFAF